MDWSNTAHLLQVLVVCFCAAMFVHGYASGNHL